jgi:hypothetical protein
MLKDLLRVVRAGIIIQLNTQCHTSIKLCDEIFNTFGKADESADHTTFKMKAFTNKSTAQGTTRHLMGICTFSLPLAVCGALRFVPPKQQAAFSRQPLQKVGCHLES